MIIGESGCGKTTILKLMVGLHTKVDSGDILYSGQNFPKLSTDEQQHIRTQMVCCFRRRLVRLSDHGTECTLSRICSPT